MDFEFSGEIWYWRGPSPFHFVTVPDSACAAIEAASRLVTYGWGMIPVQAQISDIQWTTSLWPKDGAYILPVKTAVRRTADLELGDVVTVRMTVNT